ncbi:CYTH domain-containing protein [Flectobacillus longus]|uniref:CYTH domain-containing protein n=1 Tax=Flectobacillus longus TaxID=2984207 RepID=UPI0024B864E1|nr:CYTH domain-containing protein [Flectobacillus longus]MDI9879404.1 CYTH domain-containing protein [Flectobacillus longus]
MAVEIERKFLVKHELWHELDKPIPNFLKQGYLSTDPEKTLRVRATDDKGFITIKGKTQGMRRLEFEYEIPKDEALALLDNFTEQNIEKYRYLITYKEKTWEIDVFQGANEGLIVAEIELSSETEAFDIPIWAYMEVTDDPRYYNSRLSIKPYSSWQ